MESSLKEALQKVGTMAKAEADKAAANDNTAANVDDSMGESSGASPEEDEAAQQSAFEAACASAFESSEVGIGADAKDKLQKELFAKFKEAGIGKAKAKVQGGRPSKQQKV